MLEEPENGDFPDEIRDFYFMVRDFLNISDLLDDNYVIYGASEEDGDFR